jgi:hypothetical protein
VNLCGDDDIRYQRERGGNQHRPLARLVGIGDCDFIHGVEVTGACRLSDTAVATTRHVPAWKGSLHTGRAERVTIPRPAFGGQVLLLLFVALPRPFDRFLLGRTRAVVRDSAVTANTDQVAPEEVGSLDLDIKAILLELLPGIHPSNLPLSGR